MSPEAPALLPTSTGADVGGRTRARGQGCRVRLDAFCPVGVSGHVGQHIHVYAHVHTHVYVYVHV